MGDGVNIAARLEGHRQARRDLSLRGRLSPGQGAARSGGHRSRPDPAQEHRRADPGLFAAGRRPCAGEARETGGTPCSPAARDARAAEEAPWARPARRRRRGASRSDRGRRMVFLQCEPARNVATKPPAEAAHLSIVVLPFANLSGDPAQDYLADALTDELTTGVTRVRTASSSPAIPPSPTRASRSTPRRSGRIWACAMCWKARCSPAAIG